MTLRTLLAAATILGGLAGTAHAEMPAAFDVIEDHTRFAFQAAPVHPSGMPAYGNPFVTQGYIYPAGTLAGSDGILADGSPEFPDLVIGTWTCSGFFVGDGGETRSGAWVVTHQVYEFEDGTLVTHGPELVDEGVRFERAVTGGTGDLAAFEGRVFQTGHGMGVHTGVILTFEVEPAAEEAGLSDGYFEIAPEHRPASAIGG